MPAPTCTEAVPLWQTIVRMVMQTGRAMVTRPYYFRDIEMNPSFKPTQFTRAALTE